MLRLSHVMWWVTTFHLPCSQFTSVDSPRFQAYCILHFTFGKLLVVWPFHLIQHFNHQFYSTIILTKFEPSFVLAFSWWHWKTVGLTPKPFELYCLSIIYQGMRYIHRSSLKCHGNLKSTKCLIDHRWVLKISGFGLSPLVEPDSVHERPEGEVTSFSITE